MLTPHLDDGDIRVYHADCIDAMRELPADSVDAIVTDPPYGLEFMGKEWDSFKTGRAANYSRGGELHDPAARRGKGGAGPQYVNRPAKRCAKCGKQAWSGSPCTCPDPEWAIDNSPLHAFQSWCEAWAREALRIAKPGAHLAAFGGPRTFHRLTAGIEDAGWEIRDSLAWMYGSGFPKSLDVSKAIDKAAGAEREVVGERTRGTTRPPAPDQSRGVAYRYGGDVQDTAPATPAAAEWAGWGTALKPAYEPIILARKPLRGTVAANVLAHGTGALNIDATRIDGTKAQRGERRTALGRVNDDGWKPKPVRADDASGRWPANVVLDPEAAKLLDEQTGDLPAGVAVNRNKRGGMAAGATSAATAAGGFAHRQKAGSDVTYGDSGGASRFFYTAKADAEERVAPDGTRNTHPTVKPTDLMRWLVRLVTPPGGTVLDPFAGSGSTGVACRAEHVRAILIERDAEYARIIASRLAQLSLFSGGDS